MMKVLWIYVSSSMDLYWMFFILDITNIISTVTYEWKMSSPKSYFICEVEILEITVKQ